MAAKKKTTKKAAKKAAKVTPSEARPVSEFNLLDREDFGSDMREVLDKKYSRSKRSALVFDQSKINRDYLPLDSLYLQWAIDSRGIEKKTIVEIIGPDSTGKSSLMYWLMGGWMAANNPCYLFAGEDKLIKNEWAKVCMHPDPVIADKISRILNVQRATVLDELPFAIAELLKNIRDSSSKVHVPPHIPVVFGIDLINKIATKFQASGMETNFGDFSKETAGELGDRGHNWDRAKAYHDLITRLNLTVASYNAMYLVSTHQNDQAVGGPMGGFMPEWRKSLNHRTKPGGQSINQSAALQLVLAPRGKIYCDGNAIAKRIAISPYKNSYGGDLRVCNMAIVSNTGSVPGDLDPGIRWDIAMAEWFADESLFGMKRLAGPATAPKYSCGDLGLQSDNIVDAARAIRALPQTDIEELGRRLKIPGYITPIEDAVAEVKKEEQEDA